MFSALFVVNFGLAEFLLLLLLHQCSVPVEVGGNMVAIRRGPVDGRDIVHISYHDCL
jgi:hypothetical protein